MQVVKRSIFSLQHFSAVQTARREVYKPLRMGLYPELIDAHSSVASGVYAGRGRGGRIGSLWVGYATSKMMLFDSVFVIRAFMIEVLQEGC